MSRSRTVRSLALGTGLQAVCNAATAFYATKVMTVADRGLVVTIAAVASVALMVSALGSGTGLRVTLPVTLGRTRSDLATAYAALSLVSSLVTGILVGACSMAILRLPLDSRSTWALAAVAFAYGTAQVGYAQMVEAWYASGRFREGTRWATAYAIGSLLGVGTASLFSVDALVMLSGQTVGSTCALALAIVDRFRKSTCAPRLQSSEIKRLVGAGVPTLGWAMGLTVVLRADRLIVAALLGPTSVAVYALASTISEFIRLIPTAVAQILTHEASLGMRYAAFRGTIVRTLGLSLSSNLLVALVGALCIVPVFGERYAGARTLLLLLLLGEAGYAVFVMSSRVLLGLRRNRDAAAMTGFAGIVSVVAYVAAARINLLAVALTSMGIYLGLGVVAFVIVRRRLSGTEEREECLDDPSER